MLKRILAAAIAVGLAGSSTAYAQMNHGDNAMQRGGMHHDGSGWIATTTATITVGASTTVTAGLSGDITTAFASADSSAIGLV